MRKDEDPIILEQAFSTTLDIVWKSITEIDRMRQWFFNNIPEFRAEVGFETQFNVKSGGRNFLHMWKISEVVQQRKIVYGWKYDVYPGKALVSFELFEVDGRTKLKLTNTVVEDFPDDIPEFKRESCIDGWAYFIKGRLREYLDKP